MTQTAAQTVLDSVPKEEYVEFETYARDRLDYLTEKVDELAEGQETIMERLNRIDERLASLNGRAKGIEIPPPG